MESPQTPSTEDISIKQLRGYARNGLDRLRRGEYFMSCGLDENVELIGNDAVDFPDPSDEEHPFNKFLSVVSAEVAKEHFVPKGKARKKFAKQLELRFRNLKFEKWLSMIAKRRTSGASLVAKFEENANTGSTGTGADPMDVDEKDSETLPSDLDKKPASKKRKAESVVDGSNDDNQDPDQKSRIKSEGNSEGEAAIKEEEDGQQVDEQEVVAPRTDEKYLKKKAEFEKERDEVLADVPDKVMSMFGQVCFAKWSSSYLPALVLNPYSVGPGSVRDLWLNMYKKVKDNGRLQSMTYLVYWYGSYEDPASAYSLVIRKNILSYEDGVKKGLEKIPKAVQKKISEGKPLNTSQLMAKRGREEMAEDLLKAPELRRGRMPPFQELYENDSEDEMPPEDVADSVVEETVPGPKRKKQKKMKKNVGEEEEEESKPIKKRGRPKGSKNLPKVKVEDPGDKDGPKKKVSKKSKKKEKEESESKPTEVKETKEVAADVKMEDGVLSEQDRAVGDTINVKEEQKEPEAGMVGDIGDDDIPSDDDKDDEDAEIASESDENDLDFDPDDIAPKSKGKTNKLKASKAPATDEPKKKRGRPPKGDKKPLDEKARIRAEKRLFKELETRFRGLICNWETALESKNMEKIRRILKEMLKYVDDFSAPFIEAYDLPGLTKNTKKLFECDERKELWKRMKALYHSKKDLVPNGLKLERSQMAKKPAKAPPQIKEENKDEAVLTAETERNEADGTLAGNQPEPAVNKGSESLMKRSGSVEQIEPASDNLEESMTSPVKGEKKKSGPGFSLGNLFKPATKEVKTKTKAVRQSFPSSQKPQQQSFPSWLGEATLKELPADKGREFALEFLQQAAPVIPLSKHVDHDAVARSLEFAIYGWAKESPVGDKYWNKIHDMVASISGHHKVGTLATLIGEGRFDSPDDLIKLSDDDLLSSFEGRPLLL